MTSDPLETLVDDLQTVDKNASGAQQLSDEERIREKWRKVVRHILSGTREKTDAHRLAIELHFEFIEEGHRTEIDHRAEYDPALLGWCGVARWVLQNAPQTLIP
jgi:hypothetical protein